MQALPTISLDRRSFAAAIGHVSKAVSPRSSLPVLANILLETVSAGLRLTATDLEQTISTVIPAMTDGQFAITIPAKRLAEVIGFEEDQITLTVNQTRLNLLISGQYRSNIAGLDAIDYPLVEHPTPASTFAIPAQAFASALGLTIPAAATDETRQVLMGLCLEFDPDSGAVTISAADGFRLHRAECPIFGYQGKKARIIIPAKHLSNLSTLLNSGGEIHAALLYKDNSDATPTRVHFGVSPYEFTFQLIEGNFPDVTAVIPKTKTTTLGAPAEKLHKAIRAADVYAKAASHTVKLEIGDSRLKLSATEAGVGDLDGQISADINGPNIAIAVNAAFLSDALAGLSGPCLLEFNAPNTPVVIRPRDPDSKYLAVVMPMHLSR